MAKPRKRRPSFPAGQVGFTFDVPVAPVHAGDLAGLGRFVSSAVGRMLREDPRRREEIAAHVSGLLGEAVTRHMLDAYASEAREGHSITAARMLALVMACDRVDVLDLVLSRAGCRALTGDEIKTTQLGHLVAQQAALQRQIEALAAETPPIARAAGRA